MNTTRSMRLKLVIVAALTILCGITLIFIAVAEANGPAHVTPHIHSAVYHPSHAPRLRSA